MENEKMNIKIKHDNVKIQMKIEFDADGEAEIRYLHPMTNEEMEHPRQILAGWSFQDPGDNESMGIIMDYLDNVDWGLWLRDVEDGDIYSV